MDGSFATYIGETKCIQVSCGNLKERDSLVDTNADGRVILKSMFRRERELDSSGFE
jgi:hypothetical protein